MSKSCYNIPKHSQFGKIKLVSICDDEVVKELDYDPTKGDLIIEIIHRRKQKNND